jgi:hypothetical protein
MPILQTLCYNSSLVTWTVVSLTTAKFKPLIFSLSWLPQLCSLEPLCTNRVENTASNSSLPLLLHAYPLPRERLPSLCLETALVYLLISRSLHSNGCTRYNALHSHRFEILKVNITLRLYFYILSSLIIYGINTNLRRLIISAYCILRIVIKYINIYPSNLHSFLIQNDKPWLGVAQLFTLLWLYGSVLVFCGQGR